jgi:hypothetical protein
MKQNLIRKTELRWATRLALALILVILALHAATVGVAGGERPARAAVPQETQKLPASQRAQIENAISKFMAAHHAPGVSAAVVINEKKCGQPALAWPIWKTTRRPRNTLFTA